MQGTAATPAKEKVVNPGMPAQAQPAARPLGSAAAAAVTSVAGYGMPCAKCRAYYPADMPACPICKARERMSPTAGVQVAAAAAQSAAAPAPAPSEHAKLMAEEREKLRELKSQIYASQSQVGPSTFRCALDHNHDGNVEPAAVCHGCYTTASERAERMEAALQMDSKEAGKIVYEAVWADTSDPNKTYMNAANALLAELRKRAGMATAAGAK